MRCSSCEPLLDRYAEGTLSPRAMTDVRAHVAACGRCRALLKEVDVVDALLFTTRVPDLPENFTFAVMAETTTMPAPRARTHPLWSFLVLYSAAAWVATVAGLAISGTSPQRAIALLGSALARVGIATSAFSASTSHALSGTTPSLAAFGAGLLFIDLAIATAVALLYLIVRPRLAARLATIPEAVS